MSNLVSIAILVFSLALFFVYLQISCERILRQPFEDPLPDPMVDANRLEFPLVRRALEEHYAPADYLRFRVLLECDFLALIYLLRNAANQRHRLSGSEWMLAIYFRALSAR